MITVVALFVLLPPDFAKALGGLLCGVTSPLFSDILRTAFVRGKK
jgi:hypothetical protein